MRVSDVFARLPKWIATSGVFIGMAFGGQIPAGAGGPTTSIQTEYLMTMHAPLAVAQVVGQSCESSMCRQAVGWRYRVSREKF